MAKQYLLGLDIGSSSVKASLVNVEDGSCAATAFYPEKEAPIIAHKAGWAEQEPEMWWTNMKLSLKKIMSDAGAKAEDVKAVGISYQMHGLVCVDKNLEVLRPSIIWCDSRAVPYGEKAFDTIGEEKALSHLLNSPGNFTASKLAWVKENEPELYAQIDKIMLPGDYIAMKLTDEISITVEGLSEGIFWDFKENKVSSDILNYFGFNEDLLPKIAPVFGIQGEVTAETAKELGLIPGTPVSYRAGDQPNNAVSLNVFNPGEIASTAGTSGVVYGVLDEVKYDPLSRVNIFAHVNHKPDQIRLGVLLCINGTGILNSWVKRNMMSSDMSYNDMNQLAAQSPVGSKGISVLPFGNGAERVLENNNIDCSFRGINFNIHDRSDMLRAVQEGIVFSFIYGMEIMKSIGMDINVIKAGNANMFLSPLFRDALATSSNAVIELYDTDGAAGAAKAAGIGAGLYASNEEAFSTLKRKQTIEPDHKLSSQYKKAYELWKSFL